MYVIFKLWWYQAVAIPDQGSPDYLVFEKLWNEECDAVAREIKNNIAMQQAKDEPKKKP